MANRRAPFRQVDVTRALRAVKAAGLNVGRVEIDQNGRIVITTKGEDCLTLNPLDEWMAGRAREPQRH